MADPRPQSEANVNLQKREIGVTGRHAALLAFLMACGFLVVGQLYVTIPLIGDVAARFGIEPASATLTGSAFGFAYAAGFLIFGPLSDRHGRKRVILLGLAAMALATVLVGLAPNFGALLATRAVQGLAASAFPPAALSLVAEELPPQHRPLGVSLMSFAFLGAAPLAQFFAVYTDGGLPTIMFELAPFYLVGAAGLFFVAKPETRRANASSEGRGSRLASLIGNTGILAAWAAAVTVLFGFVSFHAGALALGSSLDVDLQTLRIVGLPPMLLAFAAAPLTRRCGPSVTARTGLLLSALALGLAVAGTPNVLLVASVLLSAGVALAVPGLIATVAGRATNANRGLALAVYSFCLFLGASVAPPIAQPLSGLGTVPLWLLPTVLLVGAALGIRPSKAPNPT